MKTCFRFTTVPAAIHPRVSQRAESAHHPPPRLTLSVQIRAVANEGPLSARRDRPPQVVVDRRPADAELCCDLLDGVASFAVLTGLVVHLLRELDLPGSELRLCPPVSISEDDRTAVRRRLHRLGRSSSADDALALATEQVPTADRAATSAIRAT